jgi:hypothetical protein
LEELKKGRSNICNNSITGVSSANKFVMIYPAENASQRTIKEIKGLYKNKAKIK